MVYKLVRVGILASLFLLVIFPIITAFFGEVHWVGDLSEAVSSFLNVTGSYFQNIHGLINLFLLRGLGQTSVIVFDTLIHVSLMAPIFGYSARLYVFLRRELS